MQLLHGYPQTSLNHACGLCFKSGMPNEQIVDVGFEVNDATDNGDVFFCVDCAGELATLLGYLSPAAADALKLETRDALERIDSTLAQLAAMQAAYESLVDALVTNPDLANEMAANMRGVKAARLPAPKPPPDVSYVEPRVKAGVVVPKSQ